ncbi:MAG: alpha/beta fold hydrolase [Janthinobacterium lividum]
MLKIEERDGVGLAYEELGTGPGRAMLLVHGFGCDRSFMARQQAVFSRDRRTVSVDLRGHGRSDAPHQDYTPAIFAEDLAWLCNRLGLAAPLVVGHSMGGTIALELGARHPDSVAAVMMIDSFVFPAAAMVEALRPIAASLHGPDYEAGLSALGAVVARPGEGPEAGMMWAASLAATPQHVLASCFSSHTVDYDAGAAAAACRVPVAYVGAASPLGDVERFKALRPNLVVGQTVGSGHFSPLLVPEQINAMIRDFERDIANRGS